MFIYYMLKSLDNNILQKIFYFLYNEEVMKVESYSKYFKEIINKNDFKKNIINRNHPLVFNCIGNLCKFCNLKKNKYYNFENTILCKHPIF